MKAHLISCTAFLPVMEKWPRTTRPKKRTIFDGVSIHCHDDRNMALGFLEANTNFSPIVGLFFRFYPSYPFTSGFVRKK